MRIPTTILTTLAACLVLSAPAMAVTPATALSGREAATAVREEVGANWAMLATAARHGAASRGTHVEVECMGITPSRRLCSWEADNDLRGVTAEGLATVRALPGGASARLYAVRCEARGDIGCV